MLHYDIDQKHHLIDFHVVEDSGKEHHITMTFEEWREMVWEIAVSIGKSAK